MSDCYHSNFALLTQSNMQTKCVEVPNENNIFHRSQDLLEGGMEGGDNTLMLMSDEIAQQKFILDNPHVMLGSDFRQVMRFGSLNDLSLKMPYEEYVITHRHHVEGEGSADLILSEIDLQKGLAPVGFRPGMLSIRAYVVDIDVLPSISTVDKRITLGIEDMLENVKLMNGLGNSASGRMVYEITKERNRPKHWSRSPTQVKLAMRVAPNQKWKISYDQIIVSKGLIYNTPNTVVSPFILLLEEISYLVGKQLDHRSLAALACTSVRNRDWVSGQYLQDEIPSLVPLEGPQAVMYEYYTCLVKGQVKCDGMICRPSSASTVACLLTDTRPLSISLVREIQSMLCLMCDAESWWDFDDVKPFSKEEVEWHKAWTQEHLRTFPDRLHQLFCHIRSGNYHEWSASRYDYRSLAYMIEANEKRKMNLDWAKRTYGIVDLTLPFEDETWFNDFQNWMFLKYGFEKRNDQKKD